MPNIVRTLGVLLFAAVGTGHACLYVYPSMRCAAFRRRTVDLSLRFVIGLELLWIVVVSFTVEPTRLLALDNMRATSAQGLSDTITIHSTVAIGLAAAIVAHVAILIGVSNAASGFSESLALETMANWRRRHADW